MAFPGNSEVDLILALQEEAAGAGEWVQFLSRLATMTGADFAAMIITLPGVEEPISVAAVTPSGRSRGLAPDALDIVLSDRTRPDRIYDETGLAELASTQGRQTLAAAMAALGAASVRTMRVVLPDTVSIRLGIFGVRGFDAADGGVLRRLFPYLTVAAHITTRIRRERFDAAITSGLARRTCRGWFVLDRSGIVVASSMRERDQPNGVRILPGPQGDRLALTGRGAEIELATLIDQIARHPRGRDHAVWVSDDPALYLRVGPAPLAAPPGARYPAALVTLHGEYRVASDVSGLLTDLFGLLPSEARLAALLAAGESLVEAAEMLHLTIETARNYSKKIFAKTGTRGQADLVRSIFANGLANDSV